MWLLAGALVARLDMELSGVPIFILHSAGMRKKQVREKSSIFPRYSCMDWCGSIIALLRITLGVCQAISEAKPVCAEAAMIVHRSHPALAQAFMKRNGGSM